MIKGRPIADLGSCPSMTSISHPMKHQCSNASSASLTNRYCSLGMPIYSIVCSIFSQRSRNAFDSNRITIETRKVIITDYRPHTLRSSVLIDALTVDTRSHTRGYSFSVSVPGSLSNRQVSSYRRRDTSANMAREVFQV